MLAADELQQLVQLGGFARVEAGGRLVEAEEARLRAHGARDLQPPLRAIGQVGGRVVGAVDQVDLLQPVDGLLDRRLAGAAIARQVEDAADRVAGGDHQPVVLGDEQILQKRHAAEQADVLEGAGDAGAVGDLVVGHALEQEGRIAVLGDPLTPRRGQAVQTHPPRHGRAAWRCGPRSACRSRWRN